VVEHTQERVKTAMDHLKQLPAGKPVPRIEPTPQLSAKLDELGRSIEEVAVVLLNAHFTDHYAKRYPLPWVVADTKKSEPRKNEWTPEKQGLLIVDFLKVWNPHRSIASSAKILTNKLVRWQSAQKKRQGNAQDPGLRRRVKRAFLNTAAWDAAEKLIAEKFARRFGALPPDLPDQFLSLNVEESLRTLMSELESLKPKGPLPPDVTDRCQLLMLRLRQLNEPLVGRIGPERPRRKKARKTKRSVKRRKGRKVSRRR
jgi:hypothetical protein